MLTVIFGALPFTALNVSAAVTVKDEAALINAVSKGKDVTLTGSIRLSDTLTIPSGKSLTLDLSGMTLDRGLDGEVCENGSVILVEEGAALTVRDNSGNNAGVITGGASYYGGGICNYGRLVFMAGTIKGNSALEDTYGGGGGIYNGGTLELLGGVIKDNEARYGGGIANATEQSVTIKENNYVKKVGNNKTEIVMNPTVTKNYADDGKSHGIFNSGTMNIQDSPKICENEDNDIYCSYGKILSVTGELDIEEPIGIQAAGANPTFTTGYNRYLTGSPEHYFRSTASGAALQLDTFGEAMLLTEKETRVTAIEDGIKTKGSYVSSFDEAWRTARSFAKDNGGSTMVQITLGSDCVTDQYLQVDRGTYIVLDLNGHSIKRTANGMPDNGYLFRVEPNARFVIQDSSPNAKGYDGLKGGVLTGGSSMTNAGCVYLCGGSRFEMTGGTIYQCRTNGDGGAVYAAGSSDTQVSLNDCSFRGCTAVDGSGGAVSIDGDLKALSMDNVTVTECEAGDYGGAVAFNGSQRGTVRIKNSLFNGSSAQCGGALSLLKTGNKTGGDGCFDFIADNCLFYNNYIQFTGKITYGNL